MKRTENQIKLQKSLIYDFFKNIFFNIFKMLITPRKEDNVYNDKCHVKTLLYYVKISTYCHLLDNC